MYNVMVWGIRKEICMKEKYIELMERTLSAYTNEHIKRYFDEVKRDGLTEHGFPRLTANIGILISNGRRTDLLPIFLEMMEFCCKTIPNVKAANDFSVREMISCIREIENFGSVDADVVGRWKSYLATIDPYTCYNKFATSPDDKLKNWALFTGVSEFFRQQMGLCSSEEFIDTQLASQLQWLDENGMYMDKDGDIHQPIVYDLVPRGLFAMLLNEGYRGRYYDVIDDAIRRAALLTLEMQSPNGEVPFGGRSNNFVHNEPWMVAIYEYEAKRYAKMGDMALARKFKSAIKRALDVTEYWLALDPIYHTKSRFPTETRHGCENYAYFDKYMITVASNLHAAYQICDDTIPTLDEPDLEPTVAKTSWHFHKLFAKAGGYGLEFDLDGDPHYDASGLGRVHRVGAPSPICMSLPCPAEPNYAVSTQKPAALSLCPGVVRDGKWMFATGADAKYDVVDLTTDENTAYANISCQFADDITMTAKYTVNSEGVKIDVTGDGDIAYMLPAFCFDGAEYTEIKQEKQTLSIFYHGWTCNYTTDGVIMPTSIISTNRSGDYVAYAATAKDSIRVAITITRNI